MEPIAYVNGAFVPISEAKVSVLDRGFLFADGIYEVAAVLDGKLIDNASHLARLERSVGEISLKLPESLERIEAIQKELVKRNNLVNGMVYLEVTRGADSGRDFAFPKADVKPTLIMFTSVKDIVNAPTAKTGIGVITVPDIRWRRCDIKSLALLPNVLGKQQASEAGAFEAWQVDAEGMITEGTSTNAWIVTAGGSLATRPATAAILNGITRTGLKRVLAEEGIAFEERAFSLAEARAAREAFLTSSSAFVLPVTRIDNAVIGDGRPGPVTRRLRQLYVEAVAGGTPA